MPELPEVETLCRQLGSVLSGERILRIEVLDPRLVNPERKRGDGVIVFPGISPKDSGFKKLAELVGRRVEAVTRSGKFIQFQMEGGLTARLHLRMSGRLLFWPKEGPVPVLSRRSPKGRKTPHRDFRDMKPGDVSGFLKTGTDSMGPSIVEPVPSLNPTFDSKITSSFPPFSRLVVVFSSGTLILLDPRRFATLDVEPPDGRAPALKDDPMQGLPAPRLREIAKTRRLPVKSFLMDQRIVAGIGNIYACEILFVAGIDPRRPVCSLSMTEWRQTAKAAKAILRRAVHCRGTTISDWRDLFGCGGTNQDHLEVYSRQGAPCRRCGGRIERITQGGRGTWFCPTCQR